MNSWHRYYTCFICLLQSCYENACYENANFPPTFRQNRAIGFSILNYRKTLEKADTCVETDMLLWYYNDKGKAMGHENRPHVPPSDLYAYPQETD